VLADCRFADANASVGNEWRSLIFTQCDNNRETRATLYWIAYGIPTIILLIVLIYAVRRRGNVSPISSTFAGMARADDTRIITLHSSQTLSKWATRIQSWKKQGCDVFVYFDNDQKSAAPADALKLQALLS